MSSARERTHVGEFCDQDGRTANVYADDDGYVAHIDGETVELRPSAYEPSVYVTETSVGDGGERLVLTPSDTDDDGYFERSQAVPGFIARLMK